MAYVDQNFKSKKALKEAVAAGAKLSVNHGLFHAQNSADEKFNGSLGVEGPWYPVPHSWYASVEVVNGYVAKVK